MGLDTLECPKNTAFRTKRSLIVRKNCSDSTVYYAIPCFHFTLSFEHKHTVTFNEVLELDSYYIQICFQGIVLINIDNTDMCGGLPKLKINRYIFFIYMCIMYLFSILYYHMYLFSANCIYLHMYLLISNCISRFIYFVFWWDQSHIIRCVKPIGNI